MAPILYLIRHGEKDPPKEMQKEKKDGEVVNKMEVPPGLSSIGQQRATALMKIFGRDKDFNLGLIITQAHDPTTLKEARPYQTVVQLAESLAPYGVQFISNIDTADAASVVSAVKNFKGPGNILICWEHHKLTNIVEAFGMKNAQAYPGDRFDVIWTSLLPYKSIDAITSEHVPVLDDAYISIP